jgi:uncharacterized cupin superfamily protein
MTTSRRHPNVINIEETQTLELPGKENLGSSMKMLGAMAGGKAFGCNWYEVQPGKAAFPLHAHTANEEAIYVLEGKGRLRIGDAEVEVRSGDFVALPPGRAHAHQLLNDGEAPLRYLCWSTKVMPEVVHYPDYGKVSYVTPSPSGPPEHRIFRERDGAERFEELEASE